MCCCFFLQPTTTTLTTPPTATTTRCPTTKPAPYHGKQPWPPNNDSTRTATAHEWTQVMTTAMSNHTHHPQTITHKSRKATSDKECPPQPPTKADCPPRPKMGPTAHKDDNRPPLRPTNEEGRSPAPMLTPRPPRSIDNGHHHHPCTSTSACHHCPEPNRQPTNNDQTGPTTHKDDNCAPSGPTHEDGVCQLRCRSHDHHTQSTMATTTIHTHRWVRAITAHNRQPTNNNQTGLTAHKDDNRTTSGSTNKDGCSQTLT